jgi:RNA polymerase sigma-70 factor (ECF subfamily)
MELVADRFRSQIRGHALRMLRDPEDAEDAVQDTFVKAFKAIGTFEPGRPLLPWLMRICSNCCVDIIRGRKSGQECIDKHEHAIFDVDADVQTGVESRIRVEKVREAVSRLPERYRRIIEMRHYRHMDVNEIAVALNTPEGTIKSWLFRARALLKKDLQVALG